MSSHGPGFGHTVISMLVRSPNERCDQRVSPAICRSRRPAHEQGKARHFRAGPTTVKEIS